MRSCVSLGTFVSPQTYHQILMRWRGLCATWPLATLSMNPIQSPDFTKNSTISNGNNLPATRTVRPPADVEIIGTVLGGAMMTHRVQGELASRLSLNWQNLLLGSHVEGVEVLSDGTSSFLVQPGLIFKFYKDILACSKDVKNGVVACQSRHLDLLVTPLRSAYSRFQYMTFVYVVMVSAPSEQWSPFTSWSISLSRKCP